MRCFVLSSAIACLSLVSCESKQDKADLDVKNAEIASLSAKEKKLKHEVRKAPPSSIVEKLKDMKEREQKTLQKNQEVASALAEVNEAIDTQQEALTAYKEKYAK